MRNLRIMFLLLVCFTSVARANLNSDLFNVIMLGDFEQVESLLEKGADVDTQIRVDEEFSVFNHNYDGWTALSYAAWNGHLEIVQMLLERGATIDLQSYELGWTALMLASKSGRI